MLNLFATMVRFEGGRRPRGDRKGEDGGEGICPLCATSAARFCSSTLGTLVDRTRKEFSDDDVAKIAGVYHAWRARKTGRPRGAPLKSSSGPSYKGERSES